jgi:hypothetical protein
MVVVLEASSPSSLLCLVRVRGGHGGCAGMLVVLEASSPSSLILVRVRRRA